MGIYRALGICLRTRYPLTGWCLETLLYFCSQVACAAHWNSRHISFRSWCYRFWKNFRFRSSPRVTLLLPPPAYFLSIPTILLYTTLQVNLCYTYLAETRNQTEDLCILSECLNHSATKAATEAIFWTCIYACCVKLNNKQNKNANRCCSVMIIFMF